MLIELKNVGVNLGGQPILHAIDLEFKPGQITVIQGHSGSGISVLLKTAAALIAPTSGQVIYDGVDVTSLDDGQKRQLQTRTGFMFQDIALWANMPLASNLDLPLQAKYPDLKSGARKQIIDEALKDLGVLVDLKKRPVELSLGQQKLLSFLRAVIPGPEALVLDDPLAGMDSHWAKIVAQQLTEFRTRGMTLVIGSHNSKILSELADQLVNLHQGRISEGV